MNTGQMLITIGAMILLGLTIIRVNNGFLYTEATLMETKFNVLAVSLATSMIEEATSKAFDKNTDTASVSSASMLSSIGPDGETYPRFDDFDDYHGLVYVVKYDTADTSFKSADFTVECEVGYISPLSPETLQGSPKTFHKRINVKISSIFMEDTIKMSKIYSYFYFR